MLDQLFGPHRSIERQLCIVLSAVVVVLGLAIIPSLGPSRGLPVAALGVLTGAALARMAENRVAARASRELLGSVRDVDEDGLRQMVDRARTTSPSQIPSVPDVGEGEREREVGDDVGDLPFTPEERRRS